MAKKRSINYYHLGNGYSVADRLHEKNGDYERVAHIDNDRTVTFYTKDLSEEDRNAIINFAKTDDGNISSTQDRKVFTIRPTKNISINHQH